MAGVLTGSEHAVPNRQHATEVDIGVIYAVVHLMLRRADKEFFKASKRNPDMRMPQISGGKIKQKPKGVHAEYLQAR